MAHRTIQSAYGRLIDRINLFPQGAPTSDLLYQILQLLFSDEEAALVALLPIRPFSSRKAAGIWKKSEPEARKALDALADRGILLDTEVDGELMFTLPPPMAGFFEFSMMRIRQDVDQKRLAELFYHYLNTEEDFIKELFTHGETQLGRVFVQEPALSPGLQVLNYERASEVIRGATYRAVSVCYCRHKMKHLGRACDAPMDICMTFNSTADSLIRHGIARVVDTAECLDLLHSAHDNNLVQFGENVREEVNFICNCCGCCCEAMLAAKRFALLAPVHTTNFVPHIDPQKCNGCGKCVDVCAVAAMELISANDPHKKRRRRAQLNEDVCLGCGVCVRNCPEGAIKLTPRTERVITPLNSAHRAVVMAIERGKLQNLIFDTQALWNHRAMAAVLGVILKLPPLKQALASKQMKSHYLEQLIAKVAH
jgi:ferredoxin